MGHGGVPTQDGACRSTGTDSGCRPRRGGRCRRFCGTGAHDQRFHDDEADLKRPGLLGRDQIPERPRADTEDEEQYGQQTAEADRTINERSLDDPGQRDWQSEDASLRWVLVHMIQETARLAGHVDKERELIDGAAGGGGG
ncbi:DinB family protein [Streptomyces cinnabarinus]|uniref:DinB family protein n=1 Tax=Streptomyces cinnabarinus TaxID=67287 RepID=A0ABY7KH35_9ACTN|nr:DUF664 domain-containing protein [Streptomyces cinnabarinus]WAZ23848.1 DinB family protein [Streptomyces cinnabarinus]